MSEPVYRRMYVDISLAADERLKFLATQLNMSKKKFMEHLIATATGRGKKIKLLNLPNEVKSDEKSS